MSTIASGGFNPAKTKTQNLTGAMQMLSQANKMGENKVNAFGQMLQGASDIGQASNTNKLNRFLSDYGGLSAEETRAKSAQFGTVSDQAEKALHRNVESKSLAEKRQHQEDLQTARQVFQTKESDKNNVFQAQQTDVKAGNELNRLGQMLQNNVERDQDRIDYKNNNPSLKPIPMGDGFYSVGNKVVDAQGLADEFGIALPEKSVPSSGSNTPKMANPPKGSDTEKAMKNMIGHNSDIAKKLYNTGNFRIVEASTDKKTKESSPRVYRYNTVNYDSLQDANNAYEKNQQAGNEEEVVKEKDQTDEIKEPIPKNTPMQKQGFKKLQEEAKDRRSGFVRKILGFGNYDNRTN